MQIIMMVPANTSGICKAIQSLNHELDSGPKTALCKAVWKFHMIEKV